MNEISYQMDANKKIKYIIAVLVVLVAGGLLYKFLFANAALVSVVGEGRIETKPEETRITATLATTATTGLEAMRLARTLTNAITQALVAEGVDRNDIRVLNIGIGSAGTGSSAVYAASGALQVTVKKLADTDKVVDRLLSLGVRDVTSIIYLPKDAKAVEKEAVKLALENGQERAKEIAKASRKRLGKMVSLTTTETGEASALTTKGVAGDKIEVVRQATIVFELR